MKRLKSVTALILVCATLLSFAGCSRFKVIDDEKVFYNALDNAAGKDKDETTHEKGTTIDGDKVEYYIVDVEGDNYYTYIRYKKADAAMDRYDEFYQDFEDLKSDGGYDGSHVMSESKTRGYTIFNGTVEADSAMGFFHMNQYFFDDSDIFGGVYVNDNVYIEVYSVNGSKRDKEKITNVLKELGFPKP